MNVDDVKAICDEFDARCYIHITVRSGKEPMYEFGFWGLDHQAALEVRKRLGLGTMNKLYRAGDVDLKCGNVIFNEVEECKVVGYREEEVPAYTKRIPIYDCPGGE